MNGSQVSTFSNRRRRSKRGIFVLVTALAILATAASYAGERTANLGVSLTILPEVEVTRLPAPVQRLAAVIPGYDNQWAHAKEVTKTDPVRGVRLMRAVHAQAMVDAETVAADGIDADMIAAGQALFANFPDIEDLAAEAGSLLVIN